MAYDAPQSRNEAILQNILGANNVLVDPQSRIEAILQAILYDETYDEEAMSRIEELLLAIKNGGTFTDSPISRNEEILLCILNGETYDKEPQSRIEELLIEWAAATANPFLIIQKRVRAGTAAQFYTPHTSQITVKRGTTDLIFDVVGIDEETPADSNYTHSLTLQLHNCYDSLQFDSKEALFAVGPSGMAAGTYHFKCVNQPWYTEAQGKTFQFTLTQDLFEGAVLVLDNAYNANFSTISTYADPSSTTQIEQVTVTEGTDGTDLGDVRNAFTGDYTNSIQRALLGNNRYGQSAIRQLLNSDKAKNTFWEPKNKWDRAPSWNSTKDGFMYGLDEQFVSVLGKVKNKTALNTACDGGGYEELTDKIFLPSRTNIFGGNENSIAEGQVFAYYGPEFSDLSTAGTGADTNRIKKFNTSNTYWWLRSPTSTGASYVRTISTSGAVSNNNAINNIGIAPACAII